MWTSRVTAIRSLILLYLQPLLLEAPSFCGSWQALCPLKLLCEHWTPQISIIASWNLWSSVLVLSSSPTDLFSLNLEFFFHSSARDCLCTHIHSTLNSYRIFKCYLSGGDSDSGQSSILWQKGCLQLKIIFKNQGVLPFRRYSSDWHIFLSYARSRTSAIFSIKSKASICSRCVCGNSSSVLLQVHRWNDISFQCCLKVNY